MSILMKRIVITGKKYMRNKERFIVHFRGDIELDHGSTLIASSKLRKRWPKQILAAIPIFVVNNHERIVITSSFRLEIHAK